ncbi:MAG TPA: glycosyltransferase family 1 protein [Ancylobacter sp.]
MLGCKELKLQSDDQLHVVFDLSDVIAQVSSGSGMGGIVRVVGQMVRYASLKPANDGVTLVFFHYGRRDYVEIAPELFQGDIWADPALLKAALGLVNVPVPFGGSRHHNRPLRRAYHVFRRRLKNRFKVMFARPPAGSRPQGWAISPWRMPTSGRVRIVVLGMAWMVPKQLDRHLEAVREGNVEIVTLIHDLIPIVAAEGEATPNPAFCEWFARVSKQTSRFLAVSEFTAEAVRTVAPQFGGQVEWVRTVPLAHEFDWDETRDLSVVPPSEFVLTVGSLGHKRKNLEQLLEVWGLLGTKLGFERLPVLVIAGAHGRQASKLGEFVARYPRLADKVALVERPGDAQLAALYEGCLFTVYPSRYEGWGLPVGEAAWFGKLSVASNVTSIPEVVGDAADYFDPASVEEMLAKLERPIIDRDYLRRREQAVAQVKLRSWVDVADDLVAALKA